MPGTKCVAAIRVCVAVRDFEQFHFIWITLFLHHLRLTVCVILIAMRLLSWNWIFEQWKWRSPAEVACLMLSSLLGGMDWCLPTSSCDFLPQSYTIWGGALTCSFLQINYFLNKRKCVTKSHDISYSHCLSRLITLCFWFIPNVCCCQLHRPHLNTDAGFIGWGGWRSWQVEER